MKRKQSNLYVGMEKRLSQIAGWDVKLIYGRVSESVVWAVITC